MYPNTQAFSRLREQTQAVLDFTVLISNAIPLLKMTIKKIEKGDTKTQLAKADHFKGGPNQEQLKESAAEYKSNLSKYVLLSNFSYFEAYVSDAVNEIFEFHGGIKKMIKSARDRCRKHLDPEDKSINNSRRKLQDSYTASKDQKYIKHTNCLLKVNYKFPSELLSSYGVIRLSEESKNLKSNGIPLLLIDGLHFSMSEAEVNEFHRIRGIRNKIAHGKRKTYDMPSAMNCNRFLRELAVRIDSHIVNNYFIIEKFT